MLPINEIYCADCIEFMRNGLDTESIDLTVTSPPYDKLRDYQGYSFDYQSVINELWRVTKPGGVVVWVVGDSTLKFNKSLTSFRQALAFQDRGFCVYDTIIYQKAGNPQPPINDRYYNVYEFMFIFSKGKPNSINLIRDRPNKWHKRDGAVSTHRNKDGSLDTVHRSKTPRYGVRYNIWCYSTGKYNTTRDMGAFQHPAMFPEQLASDHIISWSNEGDLVFDPFMGAGTTAKMAYLNNRNYIGCDISSEYVELAKARLRKYSSQTKLTGNL